jgi:hypothetical protein
MAHVGAQESGKYCKNFSMAGNLKKDPAMNAGGLLLLAIPCFWPCK